jgi:hypothetical protein
MSLDFTKMKKSFADQGIQRQKMPVDAGGSFSGNQDLFMSYPMRELLIANDSTTNNLTFTVNGGEGYTFTFTLQPGDISDERYYPFTEVNVTATDAWRYIVRSGIIT